MDKARASDTKSGGLVKKTIFKKSDCSKLFGKVISSTYVFIIYISFKILILFVVLLLLFLGLKTKL